MAESSPPRPSYIFRGHRAHVHAVHFSEENSYLLSGDADGWLICWSLVTKRAVAVWQAHHGAILALHTWGSDRLITHGRDNRLYVWQVSLAKLDGYSTITPLDKEDTSRQSPWLLHSLPVNALNFCAFSFCSKPDTDSLSTQPNAGRERSIILALAGTADHEIDVMELPSESLLSTIPAIQDTKTGMVMSLEIIYRDQMIVVAGYENGLACVHRACDSGKQWDVVYRANIHSQPILSLSIAESLDCFFTSSADSIIGQHPLCVQHKTATAKPMNIAKTKHAGQQSLTIRSDERIIASAGWDGRIRVYSSRTLKEVAVLKWHREGCYAVAFARILSRESLPPPATDLPTPETDMHLATIISPSAAQEIVSQRLSKITATRWLAAGSKDGRISLWDIF